MIEFINVDPLKVGQRVSIQHKFTEDLDPTRPGGPIAVHYEYMPGVILERRKIHGREEFKVQLETAHPGGQDWFWRGVVFPQGKEPREEAAAAS